MTNEIKLLTEAEWREVLAHTDCDDDVVHALRERGLIAEEPVDPLREAAMKIVADRWGMPVNELSPDCTEVELVLAGMELAPRKLTREEVDRALIRARGTGEEYRANVHALLTEALQ